MGPAEASRVQTAFKSAMRRVAATVTVVTAADDSCRHGMTVTAVSSLSMDPPSLVVCLNQRTLLHAMMLARPRFCVNVLYRDQVGLSSAFSGAMPPEKRFTLGHWRQTADGVPYLADAQANIFCRAVSHVSHGTHSIFVGEVDDVEVGDSVAPLVYQNATYGVVAPAA